MQQNLTILWIWTWAYRDYIKAEIIDNARLHSSTSWWSSPYYKTLLMNNMTRSKKKQHRFFLSSLSSTLDSRARELNNNSCFHEERDERRRKAEFSTLLNFCSPPVPSKRLARARVEQIMKKWIKKIFSPLRKQLNSDERCMITRRGIYRVQRVVKSSWRLISHARLVVGERLQKIFRNILYHSIKS